MKRLLVALVLVCGVSSAVGADSGGWIEWTRPFTQGFDKNIKGVGGITHTYTGPWMPIAGYPTWAACDRERETDWKASFEMAKNRLDLNPTIGGDNQLVEYACFPSDFDPREKK